MAGCCSRPICRAMRKRDLKAVELAIALGGDVNAVNEHGQTAMHGAAYMGVDSIARFLAERGAKIDVVDKYGQTPLVIADGIYVGGAFVARKTRSSSSRLRCRPTGHEAMNRPDLHEESGTLPIRVVVSLLFMAVIQAACLREAPLRVGAPSAARCVRGSGVEHACCRPPRPRRHPPRTGKRFSTRIVYAATATRCAADWRSKHRPRESHGERPRSGRRSSGSCRPAPCRQPAARGPMRAIGDVRVVAGGVARRGARPRAPGPGARRSTG